MVSADASPIDLQMVDLKLPTHVAVPLCMVPLVDISPLIRTSVILDYGHTKQPHFDLITSLYTYLYILLHSKVLEVGLQHMNFGQSHFSP